jgi:probable rRNA maturation factor
MILLDPDLDSHPAPQTDKAATSPESRKVERDFRVPSVRSLDAFLREAQSAVRLKGLVSVLLTTDKAIRALNREFRRKNTATDVLSFPASEVSRGEVAGDLAVSIDTARRQARDQGHTLATEIKVLILHGLLHLAGYDHEKDSGEMARRERMLRTRLALPLGLIERNTAVQRKPGVERKPAVERNPAALNGHGFSRAESAPKKSRALAPEGRTSSALQTSSDRPARSGGTP